MLVSGEDSEVLVLGSERKEQARKEEDEEKRKRGGKSEAGRTG